MHTVCETKAFERDASDSGMTREEVDEFVSFLASYPDAGDEIQGTGGCRKVRVAGKGKGKRGGYRIITFFTGDELPVFLLTVFAKGERANLTKKERNDLAKLTGVLAVEYRKKVVNVQKASEVKS